MYRNRKSPRNLKYFPTVLEIIKRSQNITREELKHYKPGVLGVYRIKATITKQKDIIKNIEVVILKYSEQLEYYTFHAKQKQLGT